MFFQLVRCYRTTFTEILSRLKVEKKKKKKEERRIVVTGERNRLNGIGNFE